MSTIRKLHDRWAAACVPANASAVQKQEMERAFYAGAYSLLNGVLAKAGNEPDEDKGAAMLQNAEKELSDYFELIAQIPRGGGTENQ